MVTGTNEKWLQAGVALTVMYEKAEPNLNWLDYVTLQPEETGSFMYRYNDTSKSGDSKKEKPSQLQIGGLFPEIDMSRGSVTSAALEEKGFAIRMPRTLLRGSGGASELMKAYETAGFWMSEVVNTAIITAVKAGATTSFTKFSPSNTWDSASATPVSDLRAFARDMKTEGYPYSMTDIFAYENNWYELIDYISEIDVNEFKQRSVFGIPQVDNDTVGIPMAGAVHSLMSGMSEGQLLGIDARNPVAELHYYNDPKFSVPSFTYDTFVNGTPTTKTVPNCGFNFSTYEEDDTHDVVVQFWVENKTIVTNALGVLYSSAGI